MRIGEDVLDQPVMPVGFRVGVDFGALTVPFSSWLWFLRLFLRGRIAGSNLQEILPVLQRLYLTCLFLDDAGFAV